MSHGNRIYVVLAATVLAALCTIGCAGASFDGHLYRSEDLAFRLGPIPAHWKQMQIQGARVAFRDDPDGAVVSVAGRCGKDGDDVPLIALTHHLFIYFTERHVVRQKTMMLDGRAAMRTEMSAKLDGVPRDIVAYVLKKNGCVYDFFRVSPKSDSTRGIADFDAMVQGFATVRR